MNALAWLPLSGLGLVGIVLPRRKSLGQSKKALIIASLLLLIVCMGMAIGCGGGGSSSNSGGGQPNAQKINVMVTGQSGTLTHSQVITVTIN